MATAFVEAGVVAGGPWGTLPALPLLSGTAGFELRPGPAELAGPVDRAFGCEAGSELGGDESGALDDVLFTAPWEVAPATGLPGADSGALAAPTDSGGGAESTSEGGSAVGLVAATLCESDFAPPPTSPPPPLVAAPSLTPPA